MADDGAIANVGFYLSDDGRPVAKINVTSDFTDMPPARQALYLSIATKLIFTSIGAILTQYPKEKEDILIMMAGLEVEPLNQPTLN